MMKFDGTQESNRTTDKKALSHINERYRINSKI